MNVRRDARFPSSHDGIDATSSGGWNSAHGEQSSFTHNSSNAHKPCRRSLLAGAARIVAAALALDCPLPLARLPPLAAQARGNLLADLAVLEQDADVGPARDSLLPETFWDLIGGDNGTPLAAVPRHARLRLQSRAQMDPDADLGVPDLAVVIDWHERAVLAAAGSPGDGAEGHEERVSLVRRLVDDELWEVWRLGRQPVPCGDRSRGSFAARDA